MSFNFQCPYCNVVLEAQDDWVDMQTECPQCKNSITIKPQAVPQAVPQGFPQVFPQGVPLAVPQGVPQAINAANNVTVYPTADGKFNISGDYQTIWQIVLQVMAECQITIREQNMQQGRIVGNCQYGITAFGMTVVALLYASGPMITLDFQVSLSEALDTMGACNKKRQMLSAKFMELCPPGNMQVMPNNGMPYTNSMQYGAAPAQAAKYKNPVTATILSVVITGAGQMYNGQVPKGIVMLIACLFLGLLLGVAAWLITIPVWVISAVDANLIAKKINSGKKVGDWEFFWQQ